MNSEDIKEKLISDFISPSFPELLKVPPRVTSGPSESQLRNLLRSRAVVTPEAVNDLPLEHRFVWQLSTGPDQPFDRTVVVVTNDQGETQYIIENK
jgi:hypothetical protein